jgi:hypothetical protein
MESLPLDVMITDGLWFLVIVGWILLIVTGLEADKPLSGGIPGHVDLHDHHAEQWTLRDRVGAVAAWTIFGLAAASLPVILWWIFTVHDAGVVVP